MLKMEEFKGQHNYHNKGNQMDIIELQNAICSLHFNKLRTQDLTVSWTEQKA